MGAQNIAALGFPAPNSKQEIVVPFYSQTYAGLTERPVFGPALKRFAICKIGPFRAKGWGDGSHSWSWVKLGAGSAIGSGRSVAGTITIGSTANSTLSANNHEVDFSINQSANVLEVGETLYSRITSAASASGLSEVGGQVYLVELPN